MENKPQKLSTEPLSSEQEQVGMPSRDSYLTCEDEFKRIAEENKKKSYREGQAEAYRFLLDILEDALDEFPRELLQYPFHQGVQDELEGIRVALEASYQGFVNKIE